MSRCKACDTKLDCNYNPVINPHTHQEDDLCGRCRNAITDDKDEHEYTQGSRPESGLTPAVEAPYE